MDNIYLIESELVSVANARTWSSLKVCDLENLSPTATHVFFFSVILSHMPRDRWQLRCYLLFALGCTHVLRLAEQLARHELIARAVLAAQETRHRRGVGILIGFPEWGTSCLGLIAQAIFHNL